MRTMLLVVVVWLVLVPARAEPSDYRLVWFRADWCPWSAKMKPCLDKFFAQHKNVTRVTVNVDETEAPLYKQYSRYNPKSTTPYLVLLDARGKVVQAWDKFVTLEDLESGLP